MHHVPMIAPWSQYPVEWLARDSVSLFVALRSGTRSREYACGVCAWTRGSVIARRLYVTTRFSRKTVTRGTSVWSRLT